MRARWLIGLGTIAIIATGCVTIDRVNTTSSGAETNGSPSTMAVSGDGRYVAFSSSATGLVPGVTDAKPHVYRKDRRTGAIALVDIDSNGAPGSVDGAVDAVISDDGTKVAFSTDAALTTSDKNTLGDVYVREMTSGTTTLASLRPDGSQIPSGYPSGAWPQGFDSTGTKLVFLMYTGSLPPRNRVEMRDLSAGMTTELRGDGQVTAAKWSRDGNHLMLNIGCFQIGGCFPQTTLLDVANPYPFTPTDWCGGSAGAALSDDGRFVVYYGGDGTGTCAQLPVVFDRSNGSRQLVSSWAPSPKLYTPVDASGDARFVLLRGPDSGLPGGTSGHDGYFLFDRLTGHVERVSANAANLTADAGLGYQDEARISRDGHTAIFTSPATNLVGNDTNLVGDGFARALLVPEIKTVAPSAVPRAATHQSVTISGLEFLPGVVATAGEGVTIHSATPNSAGTQLVLDVSVATNAPVGGRLLLIANPATVGIAGTPCGCFAVT